MKNMLKSFVAMITGLLAMPATAALDVGAEAPDFRATAYLAGEPLSYNLSEALQQGPVVVYFFPAAHTPGCNVEAHLFSEAVDDFAAVGATVIGVTAGNTDELAAFSKETEHCNGKFPVAADPGAAIAKSYQATLKLRPGWSNRTSYLVATDGTIAAIHSDMSPKQHVSAMLAALQELERQK